MEKKELAGRYGIDLNVLEKEQAELAKLLTIKDALDFSCAERIGAIENLIVKNKIISAVIVCDKNFEIIEQEYFLDKLRFPYIHEFKSYREVPSMAAAFHKLKEKPDFILVKGEGKNHLRLGLASHFSIAAGNAPTIGVSDSLFEGNLIEGEKVIMDKKKVGIVLASREGSKPLYICPGNGISIETAYGLVKKMIIYPHKFPEPMHLAHKYAKEIKKELKLDLSFYSQGL